MSSDKQKFVDRLTNKVVELMEENGKSTEGLGGDTRLFETKLLNSVTLLEVVEYIENELDLEIPEKYLTIQYYEDINTMVSCFWGLKYEQA